MRPVIFEDSRGYLRRMLIKDSDPDSMAECGMPAGPPDIEKVDWDMLMRDVHNALVNEGLNTWLDVQRSPVGLQVACNVIKRHFVALYRARDERKKKSKK